MIANFKYAAVMALAFVSVGGVALDASAQAAQAQGHGQVGMALPGAAPAPATAVAGESDHDMNVGTLAIGYLGRRGMLVGVGDGPTGAAAPFNNIDTVVTDAPIIGVRYWIDEMLGIDAGLGLNITSLSGANDGADVAEPSIFSFILHAGVPLSLADAGHFSFQIIPEANVGYGSWSLNQGPVDQSGRGFHIDVGARAGAEIHFGFIDIPQLSLQGSNGVAFAHDSVHWEDNAAPMTNDADGSRTSFATSVQDNPWNIFTSNVAALYYF
jgi:hypothetical protein